MTPNALSPRTFRYDPRPFLGHHKKIPLLAGEIAQHPGDRPRIGEGAWRRAGARLDHRQRHGLSLDLAQPCRPADQSSANVMALR
jgi:hypothetical protein